MKGKRGGELGLCGRERENSHGLRRVKRAAAFVFFEFFSRHVRLCTALKRGKGENNKDRRGRRQVKGRVVPSFKRRKRLSCEVNLLIHPQSPRLPIRTKLSCDLL